MTTTRRVACCTLVRVGRTAIDAGCMDLPNCAWAELSDWLDEATEAQNHRLRRERYGDRRATRVLPAARDELGCLRALVRAGLGSLVHRWRLWTGAEG